MTEKSHATKSLGLELLSSGLKAAQFSFKQGRPHLEQLFGFDFESARRTINPLYLTDEEKSFLDLSGKTLVVTTIDAGETLVRPLDIKLKKDKDIASVLLFQTEPLLPYPGENALLETIKLSQGAEGTRLTLLAIKKEHLKRHLEQWSILEIQPEVVGSIPSALAAFGNYALPDSPSTYFVLHLGKEQTCCIVVANGKLIASKASHFNLNVLLQTLKKEHSIDNDEDGEKALQQIDWKGKEDPETLQMMQNFRSDISKLVFALMKQTKEIALPKILVTGDAELYGTLEATLLEEFHDNLLTEHTLDQTAYAPRDFKQYAVVIGAALSALPQAPDQVNFLQGEFAYPRPWKRLKKPIFTYLGLSVLLGIAAHFLGQAYISHREQDLRQEYVSLLTLMHKSYPDFEKEINALNPTEGSPAGLTIPPLESLSQEDLTIRLTLLEKELQKIPDLYALTPNVPKVSDLLAWLSSLPTVIGSNPSTPLISIEGLNYMMVKRPELNKKQEKYQVKVELDFSSSSPTVAREFHDALMAPNNFVDPKSEVKWTNNKGRYKASFLLKDRTAYP